MEGIANDSLTLPEVAELLRVTPAAVRNWVADGRLPSQRMPNGRRIVQREDLDRMLEENPRLGKAKPRRGPPPTAPPREDWTEAPEEASFDLASSAAPHGGRAS